jgi:hypothetical protein
MSKSSRRAKKQRQQLGLLEELEVDRERIVPVKAANRRTSSDADDLDILAPRIFSH